MLERLKEHRVLVFAPDEGRQVLGHRLEAATSCAHPGQLIDVDRARHSLDRAWAERQGLDISPDERASRASQEDRTRGGHLFHPCGKMGGFTNSGVIHAKIAADGPNDDLARVEADADLDRNANGIL